MRKVAIGIGLAVALMVLPLQKGSALTVEIQLSAGNIQTQKYEFKIESEDRDSMKAVTVTVTAKKESLSPGLLARLCLSDGKTDYATVPVEETREGGKVTYWFRIAPNLLVKTRFEFDVLSGKEEKDANGRTHFVAVPGTIEYWFYIGDFVRPKAAAKPGTLLRHATMKL